MPANINPNTTTVPDTIPVPKSTPLLRRGSEGDGVKEVQAQLNKVRSNNSQKLSVDSVFGKLTQSRVKDFQNSQIPPLPSDGIVGPQTRAAIDRALSAKASAGTSLLKVGSNGAPVTTIQQKLGRYYEGKVDGDFGPMTKDALIAFQKDYNSGVLDPSSPTPKPPKSPLLVDGIYGPDTVKALDEIIKKKGSLN